MADFENEMDWVCSMHAWDRRKISKIHLDNLRKRDHSVSPVHNCKEKTSLVYFQEAKPGEPSPHHMALILTHINHYQRHTLCN